MKRHMATIVWEDVAICHYKQLKQFKLDFTVERALNREELVFNRLMKEAL